MKKKFCFCKKRTDKVSIMESRVDESVEIYIQFFLVAVDSNFFFSNNTDCSYKLLLYIVKKEALRICYLLLPTLFTHFFSLFCISIYVRNTINQCCHLWNTI